MDDDDAMVTKGNDTLCDSVESTERLETDLRQQLREARQQAQAMIVDAEQEMDRLYRSALAAAQAEANGSREAARLEIDSLRKQAEDSLNAEADRLGDLIVTRLLAAQ